MRRCNHHCGCSIQVVSVVFVGLLCAPFPMSGVARRFYQKIQKIPGHEEIKAGAMKAPVRAARTKHTTRFFTSLSGALIFPFPVDFCISFKTLFRRTSSEFPSSFRRLRQLWILCRVEGHFSDEASTCSATLGKSTEEARVCHGQETLLSASFPCHSLTQWAEGTLAAWRKSSVRCPSRQSARGVDILCKVRLPQFFVGRAPLSGSKFEHL